MRRHHTRSPSELLTLVPCAGLLLSLEPGGVFRHNGSVLRNYGVSLRKPDRCVSGGVGQHAREYALMNEGAFNFDAVLRIFTQCHDIARPVTIVARSPAARIVKASVLVARRLGYE